MFIMKTFDELQSARHFADYNTISKLSRTDAIDWINHADKALTL